MYIRNRRAAFENVLVLSLGNAFFKKTHFHKGERDYRRLVADLILKTYRDIKYDAINVGEYDLTLGIRYLLDWGKRLDLPFVSANLETESGKRIFQPSIVKDFGAYRVGIVGLIKAKVRLSRVPDGAIYRIADPFASAKRETKALRNKGVDFIILLTDMTAVGCEKIAHSGLPISVIIGSHRKNRLSLPKISYRRLLLHLDRYGKHVGKLVLCDSGVTEGDTENRIYGRWAFKNAFVALKKTMPKDPNIEDRMEATLEKIRILKAQMAVSQKPSPSQVEPRIAFQKNEKRFVGVGVCKTCHLESFRRWSRTKHSRAFLSLARKGNQYDEDCIGCHSVGFKQSGGFAHVSKGMMPFVNVQCEACHGPGGIHAEHAGDAGSIRKTVPREVCLKCHTEEHSPDFIYQIYLLRVSCGKVPLGVKVKRRDRSSKRRQN